MKCTLRELSILNKLSSMKDNHFTTSIYDIIVPNDDFDNVTHIFLVMEYFDLDLKKLFSFNTSGFGHSHFVIILYNLLCSVNFLHSANIMHRDLKPANVLLTK